LRRLHSSNIGEAASAAGSSPRKNTKFPLTPKSYSINSISMTRANHIVALLLILTSTLPLLGAPAKEPSLAEKILTFCRAHKGEQVGDGECSSLADNALKESNAKGRSAEKPNKGDYVWGEPVYAQVTGEAKPQGKVTDIQPGDIIQLRDVKLAGKEANGRTYTMSFGHHTAVVAAVENGGATIRIFHQNYSGKRVVMDGVLHPGDLKEGWLRFYRPVVKAGK